MNESQFFFPKLEGLQFSELKALREMNARAEPSVDILMESVGVPVTEEKFKVDDGIPIVQNRKSVLYIRVPRNFDRYGNLRYGDLPRYHIFHCSKLKEMQEHRLYYRYHASNRTDKKFHLKLSSTNELSLRELVLCRYCLEELGCRFGKNIFPNKPEDFPLADWLEPFFHYSSEDWQKRSETCRQEANWTCQKCKTNLESNPHLLHAHHKWGTRFNNPKDLIALCIRCHAEQPGGGHRMLKYYPDHDEFMSKYR